MMEKSGVSDEAIEATLRSTFGATVVDELREQTVRPCPFQKRFKQPRCRIPSTPPANDLTEAAKRPRGASS